jgi:hypothetical protein
MEIFFMFVDTLSVVFVFAPLLVIWVTLWFTCKVKWNVLFRDLGVPLGLFGSVVGATGSVVNLTDVKIYGPATSIMLLTITYGGILSALGYFSTLKRSKPSSQNNQKSASWKAILLIFVNFFGLTLWAMNNVAGPSPVNEIFINPVALSVFGTTIVSAILLSDSDHRVEVLCQASLLSAMISLVFGLIVLYRSFSGDGINEGMYDGLKIAMNGLNYGLFSYISIYIVSYKFGTTERIDAPLMNWHWMEVTGFLIFMFFAPETLRESLLH